MQHREDRTMPANVQHSGSALYRVIFGEADLNNGQDWVDAEPADDAHSCDASV